ncbi:hypothetical protein JAAARDRAFT_142786 [Jaapia argillacea MUCL 33604]|uniref:DUF6830 domain-containing protein n=1 Tax=Jaapia argillacea MUCL 33604 TaxID=933084 RepID=A0A067PFU9_9AGAM|nr:hypothetical protein JAAARDRAFT_142786 [Jaapia argillacea MUCL 33604]
MEEDHEPPPNREERRQSEQRPAVRPFVVRFGGRAGAVVEKDAASSTYLKYQRSLGGGDQNNIYAPFTSKTDWDVAKWGKLRGAGSTAFTELLGIEGLSQLLGLSYKNSRELNKIVDEQLPGRPHFKREEIVIAGETFDVYFRDVIECVKALWGEPDFSPVLVFSPERHYLDEDKTDRLYHDMHTGKWWWSTQVAIEKESPGATILPIIISSDKTQLTLFRNKTAYPVYITIGNLPKEVRRKPSRRGQILLAYLPTTRLEHMTNKAARRRALANLFHACMRRVLAPLKEAGITGVHMTSGDGVTRRCHPIFAVYVGDYPEQLLVTCTKNGECPTCHVPHEALGDGVLYEARDFVEVLEALDKIDDEDPMVFARACADAGIEPVFHPFWEDLPYADVFQSITPDILHQLYQGLIKHLLTWLTSAFGASEIDARCRRMPPNHNIRHFSKGITTLSRVSGKEHKDMCRILLGLIVDLRLPDNQSTTRLVRAVRSLLDYLYIAQYPSHNARTLDRLDESLSEFHLNKDVFIDLGIRAHFNLPKLHNAQHYRTSIELFGTTDNYNTEATERLHIDFAKDAYVSTNRKEEYPQMTLWLERKEKIHRHESFVKWRKAGCPSVLAQTLNKVEHQHIQMTRNPSCPAVNFDDLANDYGAVDFRNALSMFVARRRNPSYSAAQTKRAAANIFIPFRSIPIYHKIKLWNPDPHDFANAPDIMDVVHIHRVRKDKRGRPIPARFDTVLVDLGDETSSTIGIEGRRVAQVRVVFRLRPTDLQSLFPNGHEDVGYLAYVEWFSTFKSPEPNHLMYKVSRTYKDGVRVAAIIPVANIRRSILLFPKFGPTVSREWTQSSVLEEAEDFYVDNYMDSHAFVTVF